MTRAPYTSSQTLALEADMLEGAHALVFRHEYRAAAALLETASVRSPSIVYWHAFALACGGNTERARHLAHDALARGERGVLGVLALADRLRGEPRAYLETVTDADGAALDAFARALLEREVGIWHRAAERFERALAWLERAWRTAMAGPYGDEQLPGIATPLAATLVRLGFDARAAMVLDEGIRRCDRTRRIPLLYERALRNLHLGRLEASADDLAELETHVPTGDAEWPLLAGYARARLTHALGLAGEARARFASVFETASTSNDARPAVRELALHSALWLAALHLEADRLEPARAWLANAEVFASGVRDLAWLTLRRAQACALAGGYEEAALALSSAVYGFSSLGARVECATAHLHRADALLRLGFEREDEAGDALLAAATLVGEIGGAAPLRLELRALSRVRAYLEGTRVVPALHALLEAGHTYRRLTLEGDHVGDAGGRLPLPASVARLIAYLREHPMSTWAHLRGAVYSDVSASAARAAFETDRAALAGLNGLEVVYAASTHTYSLVWTDVSLEIACVNARASESVA